MIRASHGKKKKKKRKTRKGLLLSRTKLVVFKILNEFKHIKVGILLFCNPFPLAQFYTNLWFKYRNVELEILVYSKEQLSTVCRFYL